MYTYTNILTYDTVKERFKKVNSHHNERDEQIVNISIGKFAGAE